MLRWAGITLCSMLNQMFFIHSDQLCLVTAQDGLVLGVQTTANISSQVAHSKDSHVKQPHSSEVSDDKVTITN